MFNNVKIRLESIEKALGKQERTFSYHFSVINELHSALDKINKLTKAIETQEERDLLVEEFNYNKPYFKAKASKISPTIVYGNDVRYQEDKHYTIEEFKTQILHPLIVRKHKTECSKRNKKK